MFEPKNLSKDSGKYSTILTTKEKSLSIYKKQPSNQKIYNQFNEQFSLYLNKFPNNTLKKIVTEIYNKDLIYLSIPNSSQDLVYSRLFIEDNKLYAICLNCNLLKIQLIVDKPNISVEIDDIDELIFAVYFSFIRACVILNESLIIKDINLHKMLITYLFMQIVKTINPKNIYNEKQKDIIYLATIYMFAKSYLGFQHAKVLSYIQTNYVKEGIVKETIYNEMKELLELGSKYTSFIELGKLLVDLRVYSDNISKFTISLLKIFGNIGFFGLNGGIDYLISMIVISHYPTKLFESSVNLNNKIHEYLDTYMIETYSNKVQYNVTSTVFKG